MQKTVAIISCEYPPFPGGIAAYAGAIVSELRHAGAKVFTIVPQYDEFEDGAAEADDHRLLRHHGIPPKALMRMVKILRELPAGTPVLCADIRSVMACYVTKPLHQRAYRAMIHGSEVSKLASNRPDLWLARKAYAGADRILANSQATLDLYRAKSGDDGPGHVSYLGVDEAWFADAPGAFENEELAALDPKTTLFCCVGRIEPRKGQLEAVKLVAKATALASVKKPVLVLAGRVEIPAYADTVRAQASALGVSLVMPGRVSHNDLLELYARSTCHFLCARRLSERIEGFGLVLLEAAAQRCPSVAFDVGGIGEVMGEGETLISEGDIGAAATVTAALATDETLRAKLGEAALARAHAFNWHQCATETFPEVLQRA